MAPIPHTVIFLILLASLGKEISSHCPPTAEDIAQYKVGLQAFEEAALAYVKPPEQNFSRSDYNETVAEEYDFVIVGAGSAGAVIANRLSEKPEWKILLLEAGGDEDVYSKTPGLMGFLFSSDRNWAWVTTPQTNSCQGMIDNSCGIAGGRLLGGGSSINGMLFTRGNALDYDRWAAQGNPGWSYKDVLPYFKKLEDAVALTGIDDDFHHYGGPFHVEFPQFVSNISYNIIEGANEFGLNTIDYNGRREIGVSLPPSSTKRGVRQSTNAAYLKPAIKRPNLTIKTQSTVIQILIDATTKKATGVEYINDGNLVIANARKEVVISTGMINTPKLLMLSGIGPKQDLQNLNITVIKDLPVGRNYKDQIQFQGITFLYNDTTPTDPNFDEVADYLTNGKGPLTATAPAVAFLNTAASSVLKSLPDIEFNFGLTTLSSSSAINPVRYKQVIFDTLFAPFEGQTGINIGVVLLHAKSTGTVQLKDSDPLHDPLINSNQLSDPQNQDAQTMLAGIRQALALAQSPALQELGLELNSIPIPGCENIEFNTDDYWICAARQFSILVFHGTGTARMGNLFDPKAVVDHNLRVHGVKNLRVADNSVAPITYSGHTMALAIMIGEKASDLIKAAWA